MPAQRTLWAVVTTMWLTLGSASPVQAHEGSDDTDEHDDEVLSEDTPVSLRPTRGEKHEDCGGRTPLWEHKVASGESLGLIAGRYGVRRHDLIALNPQLKNPDLIHPGQSVRVCPEIAPRLTETVEHIVQDGETFSEIAARYGMDTDAFADVQVTSMTDVNLVRVGQTLRFERDAGMVEAFRLPLPKPPKKIASSRRSRTRTSTSKHARVDVQLDVSGATIKRPHLAYGTAKTVRLLQSMVKTYRRRHRSGPNVLIGDISRRGGGKLSPHLSHRTGKDVDIGYVVKGELANRHRFAGTTPENLDLARTWTLVKSLLDTQEIVYIFMDYRVQEQLYHYAKSHGTRRSELDELFQYPHGRGRNHGIIRHWKSHRHHFHVRIK